VPTSECVGTVFLHEGEKTVCLVPGPLSQNATTTSTPAALIFYPLTAHQRIGIDIGKGHFLYREIESVNRYRAAFCRMGASSRLHKP